MPLNKVTKPDQISQVSWAQLTIQTDFKSVVVKVVLILISS